ncbi:MAG: FRG domain-containing protein [Oscillospiraceae bacterium]
MQEANTVETFLKELIDFNVIPKRNPTTSLKEYIFEQPFKEMGVYFRGQSLKHEFITCSLSRKTGFVKNEDIMYDETLKMKVNDFLEFITPIEFLSKMQHYGMPTRMVDFTVNPLIALFFAVQDANPTLDAVVYAYKGNDCSIDDLSIKIISMLPELQEKTVSSIQQKMLEYYDEPVSEQMVLEHINSTQFIRFSDALKRSNPRLFNQWGTFAICGNTVNEKIITDEILKIPVQNAKISIRISGLHKQAVKEELDAMFTINDNLVYPELASWAEYIRKKYLTEDFNVGSAYSIIETKDISVPEVKRLQIGIVLNKSMGIAQIKECVNDMMLRYKKDYDIVTFRIAKDGGNYTTGNFIMDGHWISEKITDRYSPVPVSRLDSQRFYWSDGSEMAGRAEYIQATLFEDNKILFVTHFALFQYVYSFYQILSTAYDLMDYECFISEVRNHEHIIQSVGDKLNSLGRAKDNDFDEYLQSYLDFVIAIWDITYWVKLPNEQKNWLDYRIAACLSKCRKAINRLEGERQKWMDEYNIVATDLKVENYSHTIKTKLQFKQTKPIAKDAIDVTFNIKYLFIGDTFVIQGSTSLYDFCTLTLSLDEQYGQNIVQTTTIVKNGQFEYRLNRAKLTARNYNVMLSVSFARKQDSRFIDWAGDEYEHLAGQYLIRKGIDSSIVFTTNVDVSQIR